MRALPVLPSELNRSILQIPSHGSARLTGPEADQHVGSDHELAQDAAEAGTGREVRDVRVGCSPGRPPSAGLPRSGAWTAPPWCPCAGPRSRGRGPRSDHPLQCGPDELINTRPSHAERRIWSARATGGPVTFRHNAEVSGRCSRLPRGPIRVHVRPRHDPLRDLRRAVLGGLRPTW